MPTYQYKCTECDEPLEAQQSFSDAALTECPACGGRLRKVFNAVGVVFKGSGFYRNDSRSADSSTASSTSGTSESKTDAAPKSDAPSKSDSSSASKGDTSGLKSGSESGSKSDSGKAATPA